MLPLLTTLAANNGKLIADGLQVVLYVGFLILFFTFIPREKV